MLEQVDYHGWQNSYRLFNGQIDLIITTDIGPRIMRFGRVGGQNMLNNVPETLGQTGGDTWRIYGGHRLWHAPETKPRTYMPDNAPVELSQHDGFVRVTQPTEESTGIQKAIDLHLLGDAASVKLVHRLTNHNLWPVTLAPWALTVMAAGGTAIMPLPPRGAHSDHLTPVNTLTMWAYTDMADPRWTWGRKYILLRQDQGDPQKVGTFTPQGWLGYALNGQLFLKQATYQAGATYPDMGCSLEIFTNHFMLEAETLAPLTDLQPGQSVEHVETWQLFDNVPVPQHDDDVDAHILPLVVQSARA